MENQNSKNQEALIQSTTISLAAPIRIDRDLNTLKGGENYYEAISSIAEREIDAKYLEKGEQSGILGKLIFTNSPMFSFLSLRQSIRGCYYKLYEHGCIYWTPKNHAHEIHGEILHKWRTLGHVNSFLGFPISDVAPISNGGSCSHFEGSSIYWSSAVGAHEVHGAIRQKWADLGWENGFLGYPISDELGTPDGIGRYNHFQHGSIYWTKGTGAHEVHGLIRQKWIDLGWERSFLGYPTTDEATYHGTNPLTHAPIQTSISWFQRGYISNIYPGNITTVNPNQIIFDSGLLTPSTISGWAQLGISCDGFWSFRGHFHESGAAGNFFRIVVQSDAPAINGKVLWVEVNGKTNGELMLGSSDTDWQRDGNDSWITENWDVLVSHHVSFFLTVDIKPFDVFLLTVEGILVAGLAIFGGSKVCPNPTCHWGQTRDGQSGYICECHPDE